MCGREAAHESYKMKPQLKAQICNVRLTPDQKLVLAIHQVRFCELRRGGKLVVGAGRYQHQLQLKSFIMCRVTYWIVWLCLPLGIQEGKRGLILAQDTLGPPGWGTSSYHSV